MSEQDNIGIEVNDDTEVIELSMEQAIPGISPTATVDKVGNTATITITDINGTTTASVSDGAKGDKGDKGDTGDTGETGAAAGFGTVSATVDSNVGTPSVTVTASGPDTAKEFAFAFSNMKGETGQTGPTGNGIASIELTSTSGSVKTYTITYTNGNSTTFNVTDGEVTNASLEAITGDLGDLTTTAKNTIVAAINEIDGHADTNATNIGTLSSLTTTAQTDLVAAINEVYSKIPVMTKEVTGNPITVDDALGTDVVSLGVELEPVQDLHGYDKPWAGGAGKNKLNLDASVTVLVGGLPSAVTITSEEGKATITEGYYNRTANIFGWAFNVESNQSYTYSFTYSSTTNGVVKIYTSDGTILDTYEVVNGNITRTFNSGANTILYFYLSITSWDQTMTITNVQIEKGSTATTYEPYSNICPITGHDSVKVVDSPRNLFAGEYGELYPLHLEKGTDVVVSCVNTSSTYTRINYYDVNKVLIDYFTLNQDAGNNRWYRQFKVAQYDTQAAPYYFEFANHEATDLMIELGTELTPYINTTATVTLSHTVYGGDVDVTGGESKDKYGYLALTGDESVGGLYHTSNNGWAMSIMNLDIFKNQGTGYSNINIVSPYNGATVSGFCRVETNNRIIFKLMDADTGLTASSTQQEVKDAYKAFVLANNPVGCYELATPTDLTTTPTDITLYNGDNVVSSDGDMDMVYVRDIVKVIEKLEG